MGKPLYSLYLLNLGINPHRELAANERLGNTQTGSRESLRGSCTLQVSFHSLQDELTKKPLWEFTPINMYLLKKNVLIECTEQLDTEKQLSSTMQKSIVFH